MTSLAVRSRSRKRTPIRKKKTSNNPICGKKCEFFIVQHGQGTNIDTEENFDTVPECMEIIRMALPGYVVMSTDQVNLEIRNWLASGESHEMSGFDTLSQTLKSRTRSTTAAGQVRGDNKSKEISQYHHIGHVLQLFEQGSEYTNELLEGDLTAVSDNDFGIWKRCYNEKEKKWSKWKQIFAQNQLFPNGTFWERPSSNNKNTIKYSRAVKKSLGSTNIFDKRFKTAISQGNLEYRISDLIQYLKKYYREGDNCHMSFIFANCSAFGQYKKGDVIGRIEPYALTKQKKYATLLNTQSSEDHFIGFYRFWINLLNTFHKRIEIAQQGKNIARKRSLTLTRRQTRPDDLDDEPLTQMKPGERSEIYIVVNQLLKFGLLLSETDINDEIKERFYNNMYDVLFALNNLYIKGGISPKMQDDNNWRLSDKIYERFSNANGVPTELYNAWKKIYTDDDMENLGINQFIRERRRKHPSIRKRKKTRAKTPIGKNIQNRTIKLNRSKVLGCFDRERCVGKALTSMGLGKKKTKKKHKKKIKKGDKRKTRKKKYNKR